MSGSIALEVFDYVDELADGLRNGPLSGDALNDQDALALTFCEALFDQFFGALGLNIKGFGYGDKLRATTHAEELRDNEAEKHVRRMIVYYEEMCDRQRDLRSDYGGQTISETQVTFHTEYLTELLGASQGWAVGEGHTALEERIEQALTNYDDAVGASRW